MSKPFVEVNETGTYRLDLPDLMKNLAGLESPIEEKMIHLLNDSVPCGFSPAFYKSPNLSAAEAFLKLPNVLLRTPFCVFPQLPAGRYSFDFLLVYGPPIATPDNSLLRRIAFVLECDGRAYHRDRLQEDVERDRDVRQLYKIPTLRVSGDKIMFRGSEVIKHIAELFSIIDESERLRVDYMRQEMNNTLITADEAMKLKWQAPPALIDRYRGPSRYLGSWYDHWPLDDFYDP